MRTARMLPCGGLSDRDPLDRDLPGQRPHWTETPTPWTETSCTESPWTETPGTDTPTVMWPVVRAGTETPREQNDTQV